MEKKEIRHEGNQEHHHPPYVGIYIILLVLTALSIVVAQIVHREKAPIFVFLFSTIKAVLIALFYMHLKYEGRWIISLAVIPLLIFALILFVFMPDILVTVKK